MANGVLPVEAVEVVRNGCAICPFPTRSSLTSKGAGWDGIALESFNDIPSVAIPDHEHPTHFINLLVRGEVKAQWTADGRTNTEHYSPGTIYMLPAGTRDRLTWSGTSTRMVLVMEPRFLARSLEKTEHLDNVDLKTHWNLRDRHIQSIIVALHADLEDGSPAGPVYGESLALALSHYLIRRYSVRTSDDSHYRGGMPTARLNRVKDFINQNSSRDIHLQELADLAGISTNYFCALFKTTTGMTAYQYILQCRIDRAKQYLRDPKFSIDDAGTASGFSNQSHFTKVFRRMTGRTPSNYRLND